jgi:hypothetical protein
MGEGQQPSTSPAAPGVSGGANGSFALKRRDANEPPWTIDFMLGP